MTVKQTEQAGFSQENTIIYSLGKIEAKADAMAGKIDGFIKDIHDSYIILEGRVASLEKRDNLRQGFNIALSSIVATFGATLAGYVLKFHG